MPPRTGLAATPPPRRRSAARRLGLAAVAVSLLLTGCAVDAGTAARNAFVDHMEGTDGVLSADGFMSNDLPFLGSGLVEVRLSTDASEETLRSAVERALSFEPARGVDISALRIVSDPDLAAGDPSGAAFDLPASVSFDVEWGTPATTAADRLLALRAMPEVLDVYHDRRFDQTRLTVARGADACAVADRVERTLDAAPGAVERVSVDEGVGVDRSTCDG